MGTRSIKTIDSVQASSMNQTLYRNVLDINKNGNLTFPHNRLRKFPLPLEEGDLNYSKKLDHTNNGQIGTCSSKKSCSTKQTKQLKRQCVTSSQRNNKRC